MGSSNQLLLRLTRSQQMALIDVLIAYVRLADQPQEFVDVANNVTTTTGELLRLACAELQPDAQTKLQPDAQADLQLDD